MSKMADLSLDDYIHKKNFRVQIQNTTWNKGLNVGLTTKKNQNNPGVTRGFQFNKNRGPSVTITGLGNVKSFDARQKIGSKIQFDAREHLQKKKPIDARSKISRLRAQGVGLSNGSQGPGNGAPGVRQRITGPGSSTSGVKQRITGPGIRSPVVRTNITGSNPTRQKITSPGQPESPTLTVRLGSLGADARKKIISLQTQKGKFDARSRIGSKPASTPQQLQQVTMTGLGNMGNGSQNAGAGNVVRNVNTKQAGESGKGTKIQLTDGGLQVTRAIPSATVSFEGSMLTVTKRTQEYQQEEEAGQTEFGCDPYFQDNEQDYYDEENQLDLESAQEVKPKLLQIKKTIKTTPVPVPNPPKIVSATMKRKVPQSTPVESSGPLKLFKPTGGPHIPVIVPTKKAKMTPPLSKPVVKHPKVFQMKEEAVEEVEEEEGGDQDILSPLQGYRVYVTNLHPVVNQDDIIELFGAIGALRKAKLIKQGTAEVVYVKKEDAVKAVGKYHNRELDGLPMQVKLLTSTTATIKVPTPAPAESESTQGSKEGPLKLLKQASSAAAILRVQPDADSPVELPLVHKALFKLGSQGSSKPVTFTVKI